MPEFKITIKIGCTVTAADESALAKDLKRQIERKEDLAKIVQKWLNEPPKEGT